MASVDDTPEVPTVPDASKADVSEDDVNGAAMSSMVAEAEAVDAAAEVGALKLDEDTSAISPPAVRTSRRGKDAAAAGGQRIQEERGSGGGAANAYKCTVVLRNVHFSAEESEIERLIGSLGEGGIKPKSMHFHEDPRTKKFGGVIFLEFFSEQDAADVIKYLEEGKSVRGRLMRAEVYKKPERRSTVFVEQRDSQGTSQPATSPLSSSGDKRRDFFDARKSGSQTPSRNSTAPGLSPSPDQGGTANSGDDAGSGGGGGFQAQPVEALDVTVDEKFALLVENLRAQLEGFKNASHDSTEMKMPPNLTAPERLVAHLLANQLGLGHTSVNEGPARSSRTPQGKKSSRQLLISKDPAKIEEWNQQWDNTLTFEEHLEKARTRFTELETKKLMKQIAKQQQQQQQVRSTSYKKDPADQERFESLSKYTPRSHRQAKAANGDGDGASSPGPDASIRGMNQVVPQYIPLVQPRGPDGTRGFKSRNQRA